MTEPMKWHPIEMLTDRYQQPIWIASPELLCGDSNPTGCAEAYWQDTEGPQQGEWRTTQFDMCNDEWNTITLPHSAVTHFLIPVGPYPVEASHDG